MNQNKHYQNHSLYEVVKDTHCNARQLGKKADRLIDDAEHKFFGEEAVAIKEKIKYASVYLNEVECEAIGMHTLERRMYDDAIRSVQHAIAIMEESVERLKFAKAQFSEAIEKADIAKGIAMHKCRLAENASTESSQ